MKGMVYSGMLFFLIEADKGRGGRGWLLVVIAKFI